MSSAERLTVFPSFPELTFEDKTHTYRLGGVVIPSVSAIMEPLNADKYRGIGRKTLDKAASKGTAVHNGIENWLKFGIEDVPEEHQAYFDAFMDWWRKMNPVLVGSELRVYHRIMQYGGTIDLLAYIDGKLNLIDFKSTYALYEMTCGVQLEGYSQACKSHGIEVEEKRILQIKKDGTYTEMKFPAGDAARWRVFGSLKCVYDYLQSYK